MSTNIIDIHGYALCEYCGHLSPDISEISRIDFVSFYLRRISFVQF